MNRLRFSLASIVLVILGVVSSSAQTAAPAADGSFFK